MRVVTYLPRLRQRHVKHLEKVLQQLQLLGGLGHVDRDRIVARSVIEAMNSYDRYCRYLYVSSALGARDYAGQRVVQQADRQRSVKTAIDHAYFALNPHRVGFPRGTRQEPDWKVPATLLTVLQSIGATNTGQVEAALSADTEALQRLPVFRNFYAHRGQETALRALEQGRQLSIIRQHPTDVLIHARDIDELVVDWVFDVQTIVEMMA